MAVTYDSRRLRNERRVDKRLAELHRAMAQRAAVFIVRAAGFDGLIPSRRTTRTQLSESIWEQVVKPFYIGSGIDPFQDAEPRSPYARLLFDGIESAVRIQAERQAAIINRTVRSETVVQWLTGPRSVQPVTEQRGVFDPFHLWVDPNGYRLSDRVWQTSINVRANIDRLLTYHISQGTGAVRIADLLEDYLTPGARLIRTRTPYGREGAYAARRLARTEIAAAAGRGTINASVANPLVNGVQWVLSRSHRDQDPCDDNAHGGPNGDGIYDPQSVPPFPNHPNCVTPGQMVRTDRGNVYVEDIRRGDYVLTHTGRYQEVLAAWHRPFDGAVYEFRTAEDVFELTGNHPVLTARGWVNAEDVELSDQVFHVTPCMFLYAVLGKAKYMPTALFEPSIAGRVASFAPMVPSAIAFNSDFDSRDSKVDEVLSDLEFLDIGNSRSIKCVGHDFLNSGRIREPVTFAAFEHWHQARIILTLGSGNFASDFGALGRIVFAGKVESAHCVSHGVTGDFATGAIVLIPGEHDAFFDAAYFQINDGHQFAEHAKANGELLADFRTAKFLFDIEAGEHGLECTSGLLFDAQTMPFDSGDVMNCRMFGVGALEDFAANRASEIELHNDLLSSSPDYRVGRGSGNPLVGEVANHTQAHLHYTPVQSIRKRHYTGPVYNMEVADDHSYTVNGAAVHNCLCHLQPVPMGSSADLVTALQREIQARTPRARAIQGIANPNFLTQAILFGFLNDIIESLEGVGELDA